MRAMKGRDVRGLLCVVVILLGSPGAVVAKGSPPGIGDIIGSYAVKYKEVRYAFGNGIVSNWSYVVTWEVSPVSATQVQVHIPTFGDTFRAHYENGFLIWGNGDAGSDPAGDANIGFAIFSGTAGHVAMKGRGGYDSLDFGGWCEMDVLSGRMTSSSAPPGAKAVLANGAAAVAAGVGATSSGSFPGIDDLVGDYVGKFKGTTYQVRNGVSENNSLGFTFRIAKVDAVTLTIDTGGDLVKGHYANGILLVATVDDAQLAGNTMLMLLTAKGSPGKVSIKGWAMATRDIGTADGQLDTATFTAKWMGDF